MTHLDDLDCEYNGVVIVKRDLFSFIILFSAVPGLHRCMGFSRVMTNGCSVVGVCRLLIAVASLGEPQL